MAKIRGWYPCHLPASYRKLDELSIRAAADTIYRKVGRPTPIVIFAVSLTFIIINKKIDVEKVGKGKTATKWLGRGDLIRLFLS